jgi:aspartate/methionine/tyrosine aminotransferase
MSHPPLALITQGVQDSLICEMSRLAVAKKALNLAEGLPDYDPPSWVLEAYQRVLSEGKDLHQLRNTWGAVETREAVASYYQRFYGLVYEPETQVTITCGATEGLYLALKALINPGDEVIVFEPFYEPYHDLVKSLGAIPVFYTLTAPDFKIEADALKALITPKTKAIVLNNPNNPTGRVLSKTELQILADAAIHHNLWCLSDEVYDQLLYEGRTFTPLASLAGMAERTLTLGSCSKLISATGWRVGWAVGSPELTHALRGLHDLSTAGTNTFFQLVAAEALNAYTPALQAEVQATYAEKRRLALDVLLALGIDEEKARRYLPEGAYYVWLDLRDTLGVEDELVWAMKLINTAGISVVPGCTFVQGESSGFVRICFAKEASTLQDAVRRLS